MAPKVKPLADRLDALTLIEGEGCWRWIGSIDRHGYGRLAIAGRTVAAHRASYEARIGPIPPGLVIDHLCRRRDCVNPDHMEPVTFQENINRGLASPVKTHCVNGHEFTPDNTRIRGGVRRCRACNREAVRRYKEMREVAR